MKIAFLNIADIDDGNRVRPINEEVVSRLAESINERGLRQPIEVAGQIRGKKYRLVTGGHRLAAHRLLGIETIATVILEGSELELRRDELLENLERSELSKLERAQFLAALRRVFQELNPEAKHGGDRTKEQVAMLADWYRTVAVRSKMGLRTIERSTAIGERLSREAANTLRGTDYEDNQKELDALSRLEPDLQVRVGKALLDPEEASPKTVAQAVKVIQGHADPADISPEETQLRKLLDTWNRNDNPKARRRFLDHLSASGLIGAE